MELVIVIMAGGVGTRFWPLSTENRPKQFLKIFGNQSLLQMSFDRISNLVPEERILVLTSKNFVASVKEQLPGVPEENIIGEPCRRDTAAAITLAALLCQKRYGNPVIATLTADHLIEPVDVFEKTLISAVRMADKNDVLYTFGIKPTYPATGYGYLEMDDLFVNDDGIKHYELLSFKEKPDIETARKYFDSRKYYWNSGMFVWSVEAILGQLHEHLPGHIETLAKVMPFDKSKRWDTALKEAFEPLHPVSIDFGVMEKASHVRCVSSTFSWSDVGGWLSLKDHLKRDGANNCYRGKIIPMDAHENLIFCENPSDTVMLIGVQDLVIVRAGSKILITHKDRTEDIKELVNEYSLYK